MPIPILLGGAALLAGGYGVKKGIDASEKNNKAEKIIKSSKKAYKKSRKKTENRQAETNDKLSDLGLLKVRIFSNEIKTLIDLMSTCKQGSSEYKDKQYLTESELKELKLAVNSSLEISAGLATGATAGALTGMGAYSAVGMLASASTGTAIGSLSGVAATNATLAWLGGGSLASGGLGMAGGTAVLGGLVAGPLLAVGGMFMDSKAEENLTNAREQEAEADEAIADMGLIRAKLNGIILRVDELEETLIATRDRFNSVKDNLPEHYCTDENFEVLMTLGKTLKNLLDIPVLDDNGQANDNVTTRIHQTLELGIS
ncbi:MAG TPA: hypothetical protein EYG74_00755 [Sulfurimonas autotrophica]|nr:hypothetical protein [Sulfurimonas autotrophica]